ncbi:MAG: AI-2E family transporter [Terriglobia bacterium]
MERIGLVLLLGLLGYLVYLIFSPFLVPLAWAMVLTILFFPLHRRIRDRLHRPSLAALLSALLLTVIIIVPALALVGGFAAQAVELVQWFQEQQSQERMALPEILKFVALDRVLDWLAEHNIGQEQLLAFMADNLDKLARFVAQQTGRLARNVLFFFFDLFVTLFATFYLFRNGPGLVERLRRALPLDPLHRDLVLTTAQDVLAASVYSSFVVAVAQGLMGGLTFWLLGIRTPIFWGVVMAFLALLPAVGAWLVWVPAAAVLMLGGKVVHGVVLLVVGVLVISLADNFLRPLLISGRVQLNGLLVFISVLGGLAAFGFLGIVLGPILVALGAAVLEAYTAEPPPEKPAPAPGPAS